MAPLLQASIFRVVIAILVPLHAQIAYAQDCYNPNGGVAADGVPCSSDGGQCCPYQWQCLSNGLCLLDQPGQSSMLGRYSCTDKSWKSDTCPQICTKNLTASGNEAILQCSDGRYCCDGDRSFDCCKQDHADYFPLPSGNPVGSITTTAKPTSESSSAQATPTSSDTTTAPDSTSSSSDVSTPTSPTTSSSPVAKSSRTTASAADSSSSESTAHAASVVTSEALSTGKDGAVSTMVYTQTVSAAEVTEAASSSSGHKSHGLGVIVGPAVGVPLFLLACAIIALLLWKRRRAKRRSFQTPLSDDQMVIQDKYGHQVGHVAPDGRAPELDSYPVAVHRSKSGRKSELEGHSPAMSRISAGSGAPPGYSPLSQNLHVVNEEPQELWGGYVPYRPVPGQESPQDTGLADGSK